MCTFLLCFIEFNLIKRELLRPTCVFLLIKFVRAYIVTFSSTYGTGTRDILDVTIVMLTMNLQNHAYLPINTLELIHPLVGPSRLRSHVAGGRMKEMPRISTASLDTAQPHTSSSWIWKRPYPAWYIIGMNLIVLSGECRP